MSGRPRKRGPNTGRSITTARGYGNRHQQLRKKLASEVAAGQAICCRCGERILPGQRWALDHADIPGAHQLGAYLGVSHAWCNQLARNRKPRPPAKALSFFNPSSSH
jgi:hypothetical protein